MLYEYNSFFNNIYILDPVLRSKTCLLSFLCMEGIENKEHECLIEEPVREMLFS